MLIIEHVWVRGYARVSVFIGHVNKLSAVTDVGGSGIKKGLRLDDRSAVQIAVVTFVDLY